MLINKFNYILLTSATNTVLKIFNIYLADIHQIELKILNNSFLQLCESANMIKLMSVNKNKSLKGVTQALFLEQKLTEQRKKSNYIIYFAS